MTHVAANPTMYMIWVCASWSCEGGQIAIIPALAGEVYGRELGVKVNALLFAGFAVASLMGVMLNNTVVPMLGWTAIYQVLGGMSICSLVLMFCFTTDKVVFIPFDDERPYYEKKLSMMPEALAKSKRNQKLNRRDISPRSVDRS